MSRADMAGVLHLFPQLRGYLPVLSLAAVLSLVVTACMLVQPVLIHSAIGAVSVSASATGPISGLVALVLVAALCNGIRDYLLRRVGESFVLKVRQQLAAHVLRLPMVEYDHRRTGDLLSRIATDSSMVRVVVTSGLFDLATGGLLMVGAAVAAFVVDPVLFVVAVTCLTAVFAVTSSISRRTRPLSRQVQARIGELAAGLKRAIDGTRTIRAARAEQREAQAVGRVATGAYDTGMRLARLQVLVGPVTHLATYGLFLVVMGVGGARVAGGTLSVGGLVVFVMFLFYLVLPLSQSVNAYSQLQIGLGAMHRVHEVLALPTEDSSDHPTRTTSVVVTTTDPAIEFDHVTFGYGDVPVLRDVSFTVPTGSRTAVVGPSGAGKSTLLQLAERFYDVASGAVRVDGVDIRHLSRDALRARFGYLEQEAPVLDGTIRDNLVLAAPTASDARLSAILDAVNLGEVVARSPHGLDAEVGEEGMLLSGGERQRLALARTLLAGPPILLLDEPTSNLDSHNEAVLHRTLDEVAAEQTLLVVAHRLSTVLHADQIVVLDHGRVNAVGRHQELVNTSALYRDLAARQLLLT
jgi:ABC-type multidrug transport system fused ATPase/permease subunit